MSETSLSTARGISTTFLDVEELDQSFITFNQLSCVCFEADVKSIASYFNKDNPSRTGELPYMYILYR